jgi:hypothetical protein
MAFLYQVDQVDQAQLDWLYAQLVTARKLQGLVPVHASVAAGKVPDFVGRMERRTFDSPRLSAYQDWARIVGFRLVCDLEGFWDHEWDDPAMQAWWEMAKPWRADYPHRLWLVEALKCWQVRFADRDVVAAAVGRHRQGVARWYAQAHDPLLKRALNQAVAVGTRVRLRLFTREQWEAGTWTV